MTPSRIGHLWELRLSWRRTPTHAQTCKRIEASSPICRQAKHHSGWLPETNHNLLVAATADKHHVKAAIQQQSGCDVIKLGAQLFDSLVNRSIQLQCAIQLVEFARPSKASHSSANGFNLPARSLHHRRLVATHLEPTW